jgi:putative ABC transport system substrate-binding protein
VIEYRSAEGKPERFPALAAELVALKVDVILVGSTPQALAAKQATKTIPIVLTGTADPVGSGLVTSLARPGGNVTGMSNLAAELVGKRLEQLAGGRSSRALKASSASTSYRSLLLAIYLRGGRST